MSYSFIIALMWLCEKLHIFRYQATGESNLPLEGAFLLAPKHRRLLDIPALAWIVYRQTGRKICFMAKKELFRYPISAWQYGTLWGAIPVDRTGFTGEAFRGIVSKLRAGAATCIFPEGHRFPEELGEIKDGIARIAEKAGEGTAVVPVMISYARKNPFQPLVIAIDIGQSIRPIAATVNPNKAERIADLTERLRSALTEMYESVS